MSFYTEKAHVARKPHRCGSCHGAIAIGTKYTAISGMFEGDFWSAKQCPACSAGYAAYAAYMHDTTRKDYRRTCSDEWLCVDEFAGEVIDWLDWFTVAEVEADKNLVALVAAMPKAREWFAEKKRRAQEDEVAA